MKTLNTSLRIHGQYFAKTDAKANLNLKGLITQSDILNEFGRYRKEATTAKDQFDYIGLLSSPINQSKLLSATQEITRLHATLEKEIQDLNACIELLGRGSLQFHNELHDEIEAVKQEFALNIKAEEAAVAPIVKGIRGEYDKKIASIARSFEANQVPLRAEKLTLNKSKNELGKAIEQYCANAKKVVKWRRKRNASMEKQDQRSKGQIV